MGHQVSARKYRPGTFADVVGQPFVVQTLRNALRSGKLAHAYLFFGPRGVGKTTCARILAKAINCENLTPEGDPCGECASCRRFAEGRTLNLIELDAASHNSVDDIRLITDQVQLTPPEGRYKVYIIDEAHMLSTAAFNAFLKTLEEPPPHAVFILATTEKHKIPATILSRCQRFDFRRIPVEEITARLGYIAQREGILAEPEALFLIATKSEGGLRDALSLFDQLSSRTGGQLTYTAVLDALEALDYDAYFKISEALQNWDATQALRTLRSYTEAGYEPATLLQGLLEHFRNLLLAQYEPEALGQTIPPHYRSRYEEIAPTYSEAFLLHAIDILLEGERRMSYTRFPEVVIETTFLKVALLPQALQREEVSETAPARPSTAPQAAARPSSSSTAKPSTSLSNIPRSLDEVKKKVLAPRQAPLTLDQYRKALEAYITSENASPQLVACITENKYELSEQRLTIWMPHESHVTMYAVQAAQLESFLRTQLEREDIRVSLIAKPSAFPEVRAIHTSQEKWDYLRQVNPLIEELRLRAKGQVLPHEIEVPLPEEEEKEAQ